MDLAFRLQLDEYRGVTRLGIKLTALRASTGA
jgi:hypothetical protein